jgi:FtsH-binding integral membrane protein
MRNIFISPFLVIGWIVVIIQIIFGIFLNNSDACFICMCIAMSCFVLSIIHNTIHYQKNKSKKTLYEELENKNKEKL